jgi:hypothetical protein
LFNFPLRNQTPPRLCASSAAGERLKDVSRRAAEIAEKPRFGGLRPIDLREDFLEMNSCTSLEWFNCLVFQPKAVPLSAFACSNEVGEKRKKISRGAAEIKEGAFVLQATPERSKKGCLSFKFDFAVQKSNPLRVSEASNEVSER